MVQKIDSTFVTHLRHQKTSSRIFLCFSANKYKGMRTLDSSFWKKKKKILKYCDNIYPKLTNKKLNDINPLVNLENTFSKENTELITIPTMKAKVFITTLVLKFYYCILTNKKIICLILKFILL